LFISSLLHQGLQIPVNCTFLNVLYFPFRKETASYISTRALTAEQANATVRDHWAIENSFHYVRDVALGEDASRIRIRKQPGIFARLRSWSLDLIRLNGTYAHHLNASRQAFGWDGQAAWDCVAAGGQK
jgi:hypothetical protein